MGYRVKIHKITTDTGKERGDLEIKDYVVSQKPQKQADRRPPPQTLIMDFTLTHTRFGRSNVQPIGQLTHTNRSDGAPESDGALRVVVRAKIIHFRQLYLNRSDPIAFMTVTHRSSSTSWDGPGTLATVAVTTDGTLTVAELVVFILLHISHHKL